MKFSVLLSVYFKDNPDHLKKALESIWNNQTLKPNEIVIVKDGPLTHCLNDILYKFSLNAPVNFIDFSVNRGLGEALRVGTTECNYDYVARMDSDDISHPERFSKQIDFLSKNQEVDIVGTWIDEFIGDEDNIISTRKVPNEHSDILSYLKGRCPLNHPTVIFKKKEILKAGNYKPFFLKEDIYLWVRLAKSGVVFANIQESLLYFRTNEEMFKRRGGWNYAKSEFNILKFRYQVDMISLTELIYYSCLTIPVRLFPNWLRGFIYKKLLR